MHKDYTTQNEKIQRIGEKTLVAGIDIAKQKHVVRFHDYRKQEIGKKLTFTNDLEGLEKFEREAKGFMDSGGFNDIIVGMEPTGHYYFALADALKTKGIEVVIVNAREVHMRSKVENNDSTKSDPRDASIIAKTVTDGSFSVCNRLEGVYAILRELVTTWETLTEDIIRKKNQLQQWLDIYFPEHIKTATTTLWKGLIGVLEEKATPEEIAQIGPEGIYAIWEEKGLTTAGRKKAQGLYEAAKNSIGCKEGLEGAKHRLKTYLKFYTELQQALAQTKAEIVQVLSEMSDAQKLLEIKGLGPITTATFLSETGDINQYSNHKQIEKMAGLALRESSSGKHKGQRHISKMGRKRLRKVLHQIALILRRTNEEIKSIYNYYTQDKHKKSNVAFIKISCKLIRVFYTIIKKDIEFDSKKMSADIKWQTAA